MLPTVVPLLFVLFPLWLESNVAPGASAGAAAPIPASCRAFKTPPPWRPEEHSPYPVVGRPWPFDASKAGIVPDDRVAPRRSEYFARVPAEEVRERLRRYVVVSMQEWENGFSHVAGGDQGGWLVSGKECFQWIVRPGGLAWIVYPDGTAVYLAAFRPKV